MRGRVVVVRAGVLEGRLGRVKEAVRRYCFEPCEANRSTLAAAVVDFRDARRSNALARWRGLPW
jgi:hypothetical protein